MNTEQNPAPTPADDAAAIPAPAPAPTPTLAPVVTAPRTRWAGIIWGLLFAAIAGAGIWLLTDPARQEGIADWVMTLTPSTIGGLGVLVVGVLILATGAIGLIRHAQRRYAARRA